MQGKVIVLNSDGSDGRSADVSSMHIRSCFIRTYDYMYKHMEGVLQRGKQEVNSATEVATLLPSVTPWRFLRVENAYPKARVRH